MTERKLGRKHEHRHRTLRNLATSLVLYEAITTTEAKAKAVLPLCERIMTMTRTQTLANRRNVQAILFDPNATRKLFEDVTLRMGTRTSGFVRITKLTPRSGDNAAMARLELILTPLEELIAAEQQTQVKVRKAKPSDETAAVSAEADVK